ncbi:unnamed protein product [Triticum turgidum subsp. durum]|uniref:NADH:ubiquinone oxidoreductase intermediate-associated protein 30 domain-containing protein n=1 Tax=Triticum turgidum subsp. durum TaxID=4567 RepID=A0A9R1NLF0_TRITD|nr:unnamed protein product [Triticum turgidum subsp. durum]
MATADRGSNYGCGDVPSAGDDGPGGEATGGCATNGCYTRHLMRRRQVMPATGRWWDSSRRQAVWGVFVFHCLLQRVSGYIGSYCRKVYGCMHRPDAEANGYPPFQEKKIQMRNALFEARPTQFAKSPYNRAPICIADTDTSTLGGGGVVERDISAYISKLSLPMYSLTTKDLMSLGTETAYSRVYYILVAEGEFAAGCSTRTTQKAHFFGSRPSSQIIYSPTSSHLSRRAVIALAGKQSWDIGRFAKTLFFFNGPPNPLKIVESIMSSITASAPTEAPKKAETSDLVLVTGATGGVGRRVVDVLRKKGVPVRVLVRNAEKARTMLGPDVDLIIGDVTKGDTLDPKYFKGIKKVINAVSVIVGPKEGDTPDRQKYSQGIKFFEPEIKGPSPEMVEYLGMQNLINAVKESVGLSEGKLLFGFKANLCGKFVWGALDDVVMGGVSESAFQIQPTGSETGEATGLFKGTVSTSNNGGFTSIRTKNFTVPEDLSAYDGVELRVKGDGRRYKLIIRTSYEWDTIGYTASFDTTKGEWQSVRIPFSSLIPVFRARTATDAPPFDASNITALQLMFSKFEYDGKLNPTFAEGQFELPFSSIKAYISEPITPRFIHGEDLIRESGVPYTIVRPCALTEEPAGADLIFEQGDNITGKISREEVARLCVAALASPSAVGKTFEVKSTVPFSEPFVIDPSNPPPEKDYEVYFKELKDGITDDIYSFFLHDFLFAQLATVDLKINALRSQSSSLTGSLSTDYIDISRFSDKNKLLQPPFKIQ